MTGPAYHWRTHPPEGTDPLVTGVWHYVGETDEPAFENGWANVGGGDAVPLRFRLIIGPAKGSTQPKKSLEIQGDVTGGADGTVVFTLPSAYRQDYSVPLSSHDDTGTYVPCRVYANGEFVRGVA